MPTVNFQDDYPSGEAELPVAYEPFTVEVSQYFLTPDYLPSNSASQDFSLKPLSPPSGTTLPTDDSVPATPTGLTAAANANGKEIDLEWNNNSNNETGDKVYASTTDNPCDKSLVDTISSSDTPIAAISKYEGSNLVAGTTYYFWVRAFNSFGGSLLSAVADATLSTAATWGTITVVNHSTSTPSGADGLPTQNGVSGAQNWGVVLNGGTNGYVIVKVTTSPDDAAVWQNINWVGGQAVPGHADKNEWEYSTGTSQEITVQPTMNGAGPGPLLNIWVISATITITTNNNNKPAGLPSFQFSQYNDLGNDDNGNPLNSDILGLDTWDHFSKGLVKVAIVVQLTPPGINAVATQGWSITQSNFTHDLVNGNTKTIWNTTWQPDGPSAMFINPHPNANDQISAIDGPNFGEGFDNAFLSDFCSSNFREIVSWNSVPCSAYSYWHYDGVWLNGIHVWQWFGLNTAALYE